MNSGAPDEEVGTVLHAKLEVGRFVPEANFVINARVRSRYQGSTSRIPVENTVSDTPDQFLDWVVVGQSDLLGRTA